MKVDTDRNASRLVPLALLAWLAAGAPVQAATVCVSPGGAGGCFASLQSAVDAAAVGDVVEIAAGTYVESVQMPRKRLTLRGAGATTTIIDGNGAPAVVRFLGQGGSLVTMENLAVRGGDVGIAVQAAFQLRLADCAITDNGAGISLGNRAKMVLTRCSVSNNLDRGAIALSATAKLTIVDSAVTGNTFAAANGAGTGGIDATGALLVVDSTIAGNTSSGPGGGIRSAFGTLQIRGSTVSGNSSAASGGGLDLGTVSGTVKIIDSTISDNVAATDGGGIHVDSHRRLTLDHVTIAGNAATSGRGGGLFARAVSSPKPTSMSASLIADNVAASEPDCSADLVLAGAGNLVEDPSGCTVLSRPGSALLSVDPLLGPLQDNGGSTETRALGSGSPALDVVTAKTGCKRPDQRGVARATPCDLGAYEAP